MVITPEELKRRRLTLGLTQKALANKINVSQSIISKFESKKNYPGYEALRMIEERLPRIEKEIHGEHIRTVNKIMNRKILSFTPDAKVKDVVKTFKKKGYSQAPVIEAQRAIGVITAKGLLDAEPEEEIKGLLEPEPPIISKDTTIEIAKNLLKGFSLVLINDKGKITGILTREDVL